MQVPTKYKNWESGEMTTPQDDKRLTPAQADRLSDLMAQGGRIVKSVVVSDGGCLGLPSGWASVAFQCGYLMGIDPGGRASS